MQIVLYVKKGSVKISNNGRNLQKWTENGEKGK